MPMPAQNSSDKLWNRVIAACAAVVVLSLGVTAVVVLGGLGKPYYSQATPDDVLRSAIAMVKNGDAKLLPNLIHADTPEMRGSLDRLGVLLGHMQQLAGSIRERFPEEIAKYRADAEEAIAKGKPPAVLGTLLETMNSNGPPRGDQEGAMRDLIARVFADPYGWIEQNESRLSTVSVTDDLASILVDGKPAAGVGLTLKLDGDKWYLALPTNLPPLARVMPKAPEQWAMMNSLFKILDNTVLELKDDVDRGSLRNLKAIGDRAQEKVMFPGAIWVAAYAADMDHRRRIDRNIRQFRERQRAWAAERAAKPVDGVTGVSDKLLTAMTTIAGEEIGPLVRSRREVRWGELSGEEFEREMAKWMVSHKLGVDIKGPLMGDSIDAMVSVWSQGRGQSKK